MSYDGRGYELIDYNARTDDYLTGAVWTSMPSDIADELLQPPPYKGDFSESRELVTANSENNLSGDEDGDDDRPLVATKTQHGASGWESGIRACIGVAIVINLANIIVTIYVGSTHGFSNGLASFYEGNCDSVTRGDLVIHLIINALSTILLGASNYTMQILCSPTREQVNTAHRSMKWLDIGVPSVRNLSSLSARQVIMWLLLALSSIPLHVMYNSVSFSAITASEYSYTLVTPTFLNTSVPLNQSSYDYNYGWLRTLATNGTMTRLENEDCVKAFSNSFVTNYRNVVMVTADDNSTSRSADVVGTDGYIVMSYNYLDEQVPYYWICGEGYEPDPFLYGEQPCTESIAVSGASDWVYGGWNVDHCLVQAMPETCRLNFSLPIMIIVIIATTCKLTVMILTLKTTKTFPLVTIGDAIASFLRDPDPTTEGMCLITKRTMKREYWNVGTARQWQPVTYRWFAAASVRRWIVCNLLCLIMIITSLLLLFNGMDNVGTRNLSTLAGLGFGAINPSSFVTIVSFSDKNIIGAVVFANIPQLLFSFLYLMYNGLYTCMLESWEWSRYGDFRKTLRVSHPVGKQRATRYLQLPYRFSLPLLILSGGLHWIISESLFLAYVPIVNAEGGMGDPIIQIGYSCIAIFTAIVVGSIAVLAVNLVGFFGKYSSAIPLVGSHSAAISAACHPPVEDNDAASAPVQWGVVKSAGEDVGHCSITSLEVTAPEVGKLYA